MGDGSHPPPTTRTYELTACSISYISSPPSIFNAFIPKRPRQNSLESPTGDPKDYILRDVSFTAYPSQLTAVVGPSGAGKSTLLDIVSARLFPTHGHLLLNSAPFNSSTLRRISAHVPQSDQPLPLLTVAETFTFAANLLLPDRTLVSSAVDALLSDLNLTHVADSRLSQRIVSGGELRRVTIGLALLHDPGVLLFDEPTSGLDSSSAVHVMETLRSVALCRTRTVIVVIHQPSCRILETIDSILLLHRGCVVYHGNIPSFDSFLRRSGFSVPPQLNSLEYAMEIISQLRQLKLFNSSSSSSSRTSLPGILPGDDDTNRRTFCRYRRKRSEEITALSIRFWKIIHRTKNLLLTNVAESILVGVILGTLYIHVDTNSDSATGMENRLGLFAFTLTFLLSSTTESLPIFINERPILLHEASSGIYRLSSHIIANTFVILPYLLALSLLYSSAVYFLVGLCASRAAFGFFVLVTWLVGLMANSFTLFLTAFAPNYITGTTLLTVSLAAFFLFSGYFISEDSMPRCWVFMHYLSFYKYALDGLIQNEFGCSRSRCFQWSNSTYTSSCVVTGEDVLRQRGLDGSGDRRWWNVFVMVGFFVLYRILYWLLLCRKISISNK